MMFASNDGKQEKRNRRHENNVCGKASRRLNKAWVYGFMVLLLRIILFSHVSIPI
jgi:hypothetical protein